MSDMSKEEYKRLMSLTDLGNHGILSPGMDAQVALNELASFFLGDNYYFGTSMSNEQCNTELVYVIETMYKNSFTRKMNGRKLIK